MEIIITPRKFTGNSKWQRKMNGVLLVEKESDIEPLWELLCEQDTYWEAYKHVIKVAPKEIDSDERLSEMCAYTGKTDIYDIPSLRSKIEFLIYQEDASF